MRRVQDMRTGRGGALRAALLAVVAVLLSPGSSPAASLATSAPVIVRIPQGSLAGFRQGASDAFLGVPYAAPPVGPNRWRAPQAPPRWLGARPARRFAASCWQHMTPSGTGPWTHEY